MSQHLHERSVANRNKRHRSVDYNRAIRRINWRRAMWRQALGIMTLAVTLILSATTWAADLDLPKCRAGATTQEALQTAVVAALDTLVAELVAERTAGASAYAERLRAYLEARPTFYGSAAALLDEAGAATASPYVYRTADAYQTLDLALPDYNIEVQEWITMPLAANASVWTPPYFDAGGGEAWMITRSVPARDAKGIFAIVTTGLPVDAAVERLKGGLC